MSDTTVTAVESTIALDPSAPKSPAPAPAKAGKGEADGEPDWVGPRLERERAKFLKDLGVDSLETAKAAIAANKAKEEAEKTTAQKAAELESSLKATKAEKDAMASALGTYAKGQMATLTEAQRNAVAAVAGDDPAKQLQTIEALKPTWASAAAPAAPAAQEKPKDTAPAPAAPKDGATSPPPDAKAIHAELKKTNPILAARFAQANGVFDS